MLDGILVDSDCDSKRQKVECAEKESRAPAQAKGRASSADDPLPFETYQRCRPGVGRKKSMESPSKSHNESLRTSWMDVRPTTGDSQAKADGTYGTTVSSSHGHGRRFTVDSVARPEEILASLLNQTRPSVHFQEQSRHQSTKVGTDWLSSPFKEDCMDDPMSMSDQKTSTLAWDELQHTTCRPASLTSPSEVGSTDSADFSLPPSEGLHLPANGFSPWLSRQTHHGDDQGKHVATRELSTPLTSQRLHEVVTPEMLARIPIWQQDAIEAAMAEAGQSSTSNCSASMNAVLANIATSICHQTNAAAIAASALKDSPLPWANTSFNPALVTETASKEHPSVTKQLSPVPGSSSKRKADSLEDDQNSSKGTPGRRYKKNQGRTKDASKQGVSKHDPMEHLPKQEREQRKLADRRRRRRESHNAVERRRRDLINDRIAELAVLLPEAVLIEAIAHSTTGGTAPHIDLTPFARAPSTFEGGSVAEGEDGFEFNADSIASSKPNKGIILTKSVEYIKHLHDVSNTMRSTIQELQQQLAGVRRALSLNGEGREQQHTFSGLAHDARNPPGRARASSGTMYGQSAASLTMFTSPRAPFGTP